MFSFRLKFEFMQRKSCFVRRTDGIDWFSDKSPSKNAEIKSKSPTPFDGQENAKTNNCGKTVSVCRKCHRTCLNVDEKHKVYKKLEENDRGDTWGSLMMLGMCGILPSMKNSGDPFAPSEPPSISVLPPTPDKKKKNDEVEMNCGSYGKCDNVTECSDENSDDFILKNIAASSASPAKTSPKVRKLKFSSAKKIKPKFLKFLIGFRNPIFKSQN